ncbi:MAG: DNA polymerase III subunit alpha [Deltaproteobacteria bacterium]|nr:DNA polymerase III subunit alpha [Deltaproteobacteria bacterium]
MADFVHLHLHTQYSFLDGAIRMPELCPRIGELGMDACAVTDHGNLFGAVDFYRRAQSAGLKPILGCEAYLAEGGRFDRTQRKNFHLVLLAKNREGWRNLMYLVSMGYQEGFYYKPRIDKAILKEHSAGLIGLTACLGGEVPKRAISGDLDGARAALREFKSIFEPGQFFLELQANRRPEQAVANDHLKQLARDEDVGLIATNDCHYKMPDDAAAHDVLMSIQYGKSRDDPTRRGRGSDEFYIRSPEEMKALFQDCPEAIENTVRVRDMIDLQLELGKPMLPTFVPPDGADLESYLIERAMAGLELRFTELTYNIDREAYRQRLKLELDIIVGMKFPGYFLIVADFINWAKKHDIPVGPGRGSGAGSLVAYALRITDLDPLPYNLLFERFLNPERVSMPDFDVDFCQERRGDVITYVTERYGASHVGQIATFAQMKAKSVIKDVSRSLEVPFAEVNALTKLLPATYKDEKGNVRPITIEKAIELEPKLKEAQRENPVYREILEIALKLEGLYRQAGMHAAGIVIADSELWNHVPIFRGTDGEMVTQFSMTDVEDAGLVKFDFLGLKTLDVIYHAEQHVNARIQRELAAQDFDALWKHPHIRRALKNRKALEDATGVATADATARDLFALRCSLLSLEEPEVYRLITRGETLGVFQLESTGFQELLKRLKPDCFEDIVAAVALYRPGPLQTGMVDDFIDCKHGRKKVTYPHPLLENVLKPTYGGFVYQEQVMQAAQVMAGYSLGGADLLRRAMGKKKPEVMAKERVKFTEGCVARGIAEKEATEVFDLMEKFAGYGFNKSHSAAYALITFQTAYLKTFYPVEFMAALLTTEANSTENIVKYISEARSMGISVLPPTVNDSDISFTVPGGKIRFGLGAIKGLGEAALHAILDAREKAGGFSTLYNFCERVSIRHLNRKTLETLVRSGAFDCFKRPRAQLLDAIDRAIDAARSTQRASEVGQASLFGAPGLAEAIKPKEVYDPAIREWPELERLRLEKEAIGFYVSGHPLDRYRDDLVRMTNATIAGLEKKGHRAEVVLGCVVSALRERPLRDGSGRMAFVTVEDLTGAVEMAVSARVFGEIELLLKADAPLLLTASVSMDGDEEGNQRMRLRCLGAKPLAEARGSRAKAVIVTLDGARVRTNGTEVQGAVDLGALHDALVECHGVCPVRVVVRLAGLGEVDVDLAERLRVEPTDTLVDRIEQIVGAGSVRFV